MEGWYGDGNSSRGWQASETDAAGLGEGGIEAALLTVAASMHAEAGIVTVNTIVFSYRGRADR